MSNSSLTDRGVANARQTETPTETPTEGSVTESHVPESGSLHAIVLVARREIVTRARTKSFLISNAIILVLILGGIVGISIFTGRSDTNPRVGLVGTAASLSGPLSAAAAASRTPVDTKTVPDVATARSKVASGDLDLAIVPGPDGSYTAIVDEEVSPQLGPVIDATVRQVAINAALTAQGVDPTALAKAAESAKVTVNAVNAPNPDSDQRTGLAYIAMLLMFFQLLMFGLYVAMGVVEEKSSRVVEVLLATIKPLHLLCGKVLGIGAVGLAQLAAYGIAGLTAGVGTGLVTVTTTAVGVFASVLVWFVLGYAFYAMAYAAAGSLVSRQEDVNSAATPITMVIMASYLLAQVTLQDPGGTLSAVMAWIPPFSAMLMPLRIAAGTTDPLQVIGSAVLMLLATAALAVVAARIYERSVMRTGKRVGWGEAIRASRAG